MFYSPGRSISRILVQKFGAFQAVEQIEIGDWTSRFKFEGHTVQADFDMECTHRTPSPVGTFHVKISTAS